MKYLVPEPMALEMREIVSHHLAEDEYADPASETPGYLVQSVYLDNPALQLYRQTLRGFRNRFKLRVRVYDETGPAFLEVKRRENVAVIKHRACVKRHAAEAVIAGFWPEHDGLLSTKLDHEFANMRYFCQQRDNLGAYPAATVTYHREAFASSCGNARVTFDRNVRGSVAPGDRPLLLTDDAWYPRLPGVILELKYTDKVPRWMPALVQQFQLRQMSIPKYCHCIDTMREAGVLVDSRLTRNVG
jgi:SPX domain protein involved in polyphosphate accumulation